MKFRASFYRAEAFSPGSYLNPRFSQSVISSPLPRFFCGHAVTDRSLDVSIVARCYFELPKDIENLYYLVILLVNSWEETDIKPCHL